MGTSDQQVRVWSRVPVHCKFEYHVTNKGAGVHPECALDQVVVLMVMHYSIGCVVTAFLCILSVNIYIKVRDFP